VIAAFGALNVCTAFAQDMTLTSTEVADGGTIKEAQVERLLGLLASGQDPAASGTESFPTVGALAQAYLAFAKTRQKPRSFVETERHLMVNWAPRREVGIVDVTRRQVATGLAVIEAEKGSVAARCARSALSSMFTWAIREGYELAVNPVSGTNPPAEPPSRASQRSGRRIGGHIRCHSRRRR
jgi:hypothetical protein